MMASWEIEDPLRPDLSQFTASELEEFLLEYKQTLEEDYYQEMKRLLGAGAYPQTAKGQDKLFAEAWVTARTGNLARRQAIAVSEARRAYRVEHGLGEFDPAEFPSWREMALQCAVVAVLPQASHAPAFADMSFSSLTAMSANSFLQAAFAQAK